MALEQWPTKIAESVKLLIPQDYDPYHAGKPGKCFITLNIEKKCLVVVSEENGSVIDIIDPTDIVGASAEIEFSESAEGRRSTVRQQTSTSSDSDDDAAKEQQRDDNEPASDTPVDTQGVAILKIYAYPRIHPDEKPMFSSCGFPRKRKTKPVFPSDEELDSSAFGPRRARHRSFQVAPAEDLSELSALVTGIKKISRPEATEDRLLVVVNPFSGTKQGLKVYNTVVAPLFEQAGIDYDHLITTHPNHALERMEEKKEGSSVPDLSKYDGIIAIGGDGIIHEMFQGIHKRSDCDAILRNLKLGVVGAGTSNGLNKSLAHASKERATPQDYAFLIAKGKTSKMDLSKYETKNSSYLSFLTFSWAMIADIDIESELIRFMGTVRMDLWGAWRVLNLRKYRAKFSYLPPTPGKQIAKCPPLDKPIPKDDDWVISEEEFVIFWASQVSHAAENTCHTPQSKLDDGVFEIFIVRGTVNRFRLAMILIALENGGHANMPGVEFIRCSAYRLEPITPGSFNDLDGEVIEDGPIQGHVLPGAINVYCSPRD